MLKYSSRLLSLIELRRFNARRLMCTFDKSVAIPENNLIDDKKDIRIIYAVRKSRIILPYKRNLYHIQRRTNTNKCEATTTDASDESDSDGSCKSATSSCGSSSSGSSGSSSSGSSSSSSGSSSSSDDESKCIEKPQTSTFWRNFSYAAIPLIIALSVLILGMPHKEEHVEYIPYEYMYRSTRSYPWGDGKHSFFHGKYNLIPEEEEKRIDREIEENTPPPPEKKPKKPPPPPPKEPRYKSTVNVLEEKKKLREQHANEEAQRRKRRREIEKEREQQKEPKDGEKPEE